MSTFFGKTLEAGSLGASGCALRAATDDDDPDSSCPTCLEAYDAAGGNPRAWTSCGHHFHVQCIYAWFERGKETCPVCEARIDVEDVDVELEQSGVGAAGAGAGGGGGGGGAGAGD
jgi:hypothetical protein